MIDFTNVTDVTIGGKAAKKIMCGALVIWEKESSGEPDGPVVVFPATKVSTIYWPPSTMLSSAITLTRTVSVGENYIIYINGTAHEATATASGSSIRLYSDDGKVMFSSSDGIKFDGDISGRYTSPTIEIHYIP